jgi:hypothetical protein
MDADPAPQTLPRPPRRRRRLRLVLLAVLGVLVLVLVVSLLPAVFALTACSADEKRVFAELRHYGGVRLEPSGNTDTGGCAATYRAPASEERVLAHYHLALRAQGWTMQPAETRTGSDVQGVAFRSGELHGRRGAFTVAVLYEAGPALRGGGTHVAAHVAED